MRPQIDEIDHIHVYVKDRYAASAWYASILDLHPVESLMTWASNAGPLTLANSADSVHLALFERAEHIGDAAIAFSTTGAVFIQWMAFLESQEISYRIADHSLAYSMYFTDPDNNMLEITTYDHEVIRGHLHTNQP